jgi:hypothetical protein
VTAHRVSPTRTGWHGPRLLGLACTTTVAMGHGEAQRNSALCQFPFKLFNSNSNQILNLVQTHLILVQA